MSKSFFSTTFVIVILCLTAALSCFSQDQNDEYLKWTRSQAEQIGKSTLEKGRAGSAFDFRVVNTNHAINYKLRATLMSPEVIRASARVFQLDNRLSDLETKGLVDQAESVAELVIMVEIDPREGSGVIPLDWRVILQPKGLKVGSEGAFAGIKSPQFKGIKGLMGVKKRDYAYDVFWVSFPLKDKDNKPIFDEKISEIELIVGIYGKEGSVSWKLPNSIYQKLHTGVK